MTDMHAKIVAEARAERDAQGYDQRWIDADGNIVLHRTSGAHPIGEVSDNEHSA